MDKQGAYYDELETRPPEERERALMQALPRTVANAMTTEGFAAILKGTDAMTVDSRAALAALPVTRKADLARLQAERPPYAGFTTVPTGGLARLFLSPGPICEPEARRPDYWRLARALYAAGLRQSEILHNCFSYHLTPAGSMLESGAHAVGAAVMPGGIGNTEMQVQAIAAYGAHFYGGTPSFLRIILEKAGEMGVKLPSLTRALVSGEALPPSLRAELEGLGVRTLQCYASADLGLMAYESEALEGMIVDEGVILEIVRPGTGDPVPEGEVGEVVVTTLNPEYPLVRFATGDLSAVLPGVSPCGRTNLRIRGWMGRADQSTKVRGMFVHPHQIAELLRRHPEVVKARLTVDSSDNRDSMVLACEVPGGGHDGLAEALVASVQDVCKLRGEVRIVAPGSLPNDGKVIEDARSYA